MKINRKNAINHTVIITFVAIFYATIVSLINISDILIIIFGIIIGITTAKLCNIKWPLWN